MLPHAGRLRRLPALVVGGGVGGLTAALALHRVGVPPALATRETALARPGGAVFLMRGALRILDRLGLGPRTRVIGLPVCRAEVYGVAGARLFTLNLAEEEVYAVPRPRLRQAFVEALPPGCVSFGTAFKRLDLEDVDTVAGVGVGAGAGVEVTLRDVAGAADFQVAAETVIGADGGRSAVRSFITHPGASRATGVTAFRATVQNADATTYPMHVIREVWGDRGRGATSPHLRFGFCRITPSDVYWWASIIGNRAAAAAGAGAGRHAGAREEDIVLRPFGRKLAERFGAFPFDAAPLIGSTAEAEIERTEIRTFALRDNPWLDPSGRVILVGDAARQSDLPYLHHGSSMAIEDGYALANAVDLSARAGRSRRPLDAYELARREHTRSLHRIWHSFDRLAASRNPVTRYVNSKVLSVSLTKHLMEARSTTERRGDALDARGLELRGGGGDDHADSGRGGLLPLPPPPPPPVV